MQPADIEQFVLWSLDHTGRYPQLWFPKVRREHINFPPEPTDGRGSRSSFRLIRNGSITVLNAAGRPSVGADDLRPEMLLDVQADGRPTYVLDLEECIRHDLHAALERSRVPPRGHFELFAHGNDFDVNIYLASAETASSSAAGDRKYRAGAGWSFIANSSMS